MLALAASQPASPNGKGDTSTYFDSVVFLTMFLLIGKSNFQCHHVRYWLISGVEGKYLEAYSRSHTADAITNLGKLRPAEAYLLSPRLQRDPSTRFRYSEDDLERGSISSEDDLYIESHGFGIQKTSVDHLEVGDVVRVQKGSSPPTDGTVVSGESCFDESSLTGEARLIKKKVGDKVFLGTINDSRALDVRVDAIGGDTMYVQLT